MHFQLMQATTPLQAFHCLIHKKVFFITFSVFPGTYIFFISRLVLLPCLSVRPERGLFYVRHLDLLLLFRETKENRMWKANPVSPNDVWLEMQLLRWRVSSMECWCFVFFFRLCLPGVCSELLSWLQDTKRSFLCSMFFLGGNK